MRCSGHEKIDRDRPPLLQRHVIWVLVHACVANTRLLVAHVYINQSTREWLMQQRLLCCVQVSKTSRLGLVTHTTDRVCILDVVDNTLSIRACMHSYSHSYTAIVASDYSSTSTQRIPVLVELQQLFHP
jgi:hypothetical protein